MAEVATKRLVPLFRLKPVRCDRMNLLPCMFCGVRSAFQVPGPITREDVWGPERYRPWP